MRRPVADDSATSCTAAKFPYHRQPTRQSAERTGIRACVRVRVEGALKGGGGQGDAPRMHEHEAAELAVVLSLVAPDVATGLVVSGFDRLHHFCINNRPPLFEIGILRRSPSTLVQNRFSATHTPKLKRKKWVCEVRVAVRCADGRPESAAAVPTASRDRVRPRSRCRRESRPIWFGARQSLDGEPSDLARAEHGPQLCKWPSIAAGAE